MVTKDFFFNRDKVYKILPWQVYPSPVNPGLQEQLYDPTTFVQLAFFLLQLCVSLAHSSMSEMQSKEYTCGHDHEY